jgi:predicted RNase H-like HicB family nuclease
MKIKVLIWQEDDVWCASVPAFKGCHSWGETYDEAVFMITEAAQGWLEVANQRKNEQTQTQNIKEFELAL